MRTKLGFMGVTTCWPVSSESGFGRDRPEVLAVEEDLRVGHVIEAVDLQPEC